MAEISTICGTFSVCKWLYLGPRLIGSYLGKWRKKPARICHVCWRSKICNALPAMKLEQEEMRVVGGIDVLVKLVG